MTPDHPKVSVLMPAYNGGRFIREAIDSILAQSCADFEFLIIDDGSTDDTAAIVQTYSDARIRLVHNGANLGVAGSLNLGLALCHGEYIARMDADDVSMPQRLARQVAFLDRHPQVCCVVVKVRTIDQNGVFLGTWDDDAETTTFEEIVGMLPYRNCIAHPGIMIRRNILLKFRYNRLVRDAEDYDLWMRLVASGYRIEKIDEALLSYRVIPTSITSLSNAKSARKRLLSVKLHYLFWAVSTWHLGFFTWRVAGSVLTETSRGARDVVIYALKRAVFRARV